MKIFIGDTVTFDYSFEGFQRTYRGKVCEIYKVDNAEYAKVDWYDGGWNKEIRTCYLKIDTGAIMAKAWEDKYPSMKFDPVTRKIVPKKPQKEMKRADNFVWINGPDDKN